MVLPSPGLKLEMGFTPGRWLGHNKFPKSGGCHLWLSASSSVSSPPESLSRDYPEQILLPSCLLSEGVTGRERPTEHKSVGR